MFWSWKDRFSLLVLSALGQAQIVSSYFQMFISVFLLPHSMFPPICNFSVSTLCPMLSGHSIYTHLILLIWNIIPTSSLSISPSVTDHYSTQSSTIHMNSSLCSLPDLPFWVPIVLNYRSNVLILLWEDLRWYYLSIWFSTLDFKHILWFLNDKIIKILNKCFKTFCWLQKEHMVIVEVSKKSLY